jgi:hypothetical protein
MAVSKRLRFEILRRDNHACRYCGATAPEAKLTVDHVIPVALGGGDIPENLVTACWDCNSGKSSVPADAPLLADVEADALRWSRAMTQVAAIRAQEIESRAFIADWFKNLWQAWHYGPDRNPIPAPDGGFTAVLKFFDAGLTEIEIEDLLNVAMRASHISPDSTWRYFCGCCWKRIRENAEMAADILKAEEGAD